MGFIMLSILPSGLLWSEAHLIERASLGSGVVRSVSRSGLSPVSLASYSATSKNLN